MLTIEQVKKRLELLNIKAFAEFAGVHPNSVYLLKKGCSDNSISYSTLKRISDALVSIGDANADNN